MCTVCRNIIIQLKQLGLIFFVVFWKMNTQKMFCCSIPIPREILRQKVIWFLSSILDLGDQDGLSHGLPSTYSSFSICSVYMFPNNSQFKTFIIFDVWILIWIIQRIHKLKHLNNNPAKKNMLTCIVSEHSYYSITIHSFLK